jgi:hypothetical protein
VLALSEGIGGGAWQAGLVLRIQETAWVLGYQEDLDADFLAIYGIDLGDCDLSGPRYFALAHRLTAYTGVMAARAEEEREQDSPPPSAETAAQARPASSPRDRQEVSLTAFRVQFPGLVSIAQPETEGG